LEEELGGNVARNRELRNSLSVSVRKGKRPNAANIREWRIILKWI
jgi:hypothetical protein